MRTQHHNVGIGGLVRLGLLVWCLLVGCGGGDDDPPPEPVVRGRVLFEKVFVGPNGLDVRQKVTIPVRRARIELVDTRTGAIVSTDRTGEDGQFVLRGGTPTALVQVLTSTRNPAYNVDVLDPRDKTLHGATLPTFDASAPVTLGDVIMPDAGRLSAPFNILEVIHRVMERVLAVDATVQLPPLEVFWHRTNTNGTFFDGMHLWLLGNRAIDDDAMDDDVIVHEFGHVLELHCARSDSPGGKHDVRGEAKHPALAWSEGWANVLAGIVSGQPQYTDTYADGIAVRIDFEPAMFWGRTRGQSPVVFEDDVGPLLWDLLDAAADEADQVAVSWATYWKAFRALQTARLVHLGAFLEAVLAIEPSMASGVTMLTERFGFRAAPPIPTPLSVGQAYRGTLGASEPLLFNDVRLANFFDIRLPASRALTITLEVASANLDLLFYPTIFGGADTRRSVAAGTVAERIVTPVLAPGTYMVEVRLATTHEVVRALGTYTLTIH